MTRWCRWFFTAAALSLAAPQAAGAPLAERDDRGVTVVLAAPARRIVTLAPNLAELVHAAGAGERLVGVSAHSDYPPEVKKLPQIGGFGHFDLERLVQLKPDLAIAWESGNSALEVTLLARLGIPLYVAEAHRLEDIPRHIEAIGRLAGSAEVARRGAADFRSAAAALAARYAGSRPLTVFHEIWYQPLMTVNDRHLIGDAIRLCGGVNPFGGLDALIPTVAVESVLAADPALIVTSGPTAQWQRYPALRAVRNGRVKAIDRDYLHRATPRMLEGVRQLCDLLDEARD